MILVLELQESSEIILAQGLFLSSSFQSELEEATFSKKKKICPTTVSPHST